MRRAVTARDLFEAYRPGVNPELGDLRFVREELPEAPEPTAVLERLPQQGTVAAGVRAGSRRETLQYPRDDPLDFEGQDTPVTKAEEVGSIAHLFERGDGKDPESLGTQVPGERLGSRYTVPSVSGPRPVYLDLRCP